MSRRDRAQARDRFEIWRGMTEDERAAARERYREFRRLPPGERARLLDVYRRYRQLPLERRIELRERFRELTPEQRRTLRERAPRPGARPPIVKVENDFPAIVGYPTTWRCSCAGLTLAELPLHRHPVRLGDAAHGVLSSRAVRDGSPRRVAGYKDLTA